MDTIIRLMADGLVAVIVVIGGFVFFVSIRRDLYQQYLRAFMAGITSYVFAKILSLLYESHERPFVSLGVSPKAAYLDNPGFPSDHAVFVMAIALIVVCVTKRKWVGGVLIALALVVGLGRVLALVHSPIDIAGGFLAAAAGVFLWYGGGFWANKKLHKKQK